MHFRLPVNFGFGGVAIGNGFSPMTNAESDTTLAAAWDAGIRFYDTSPFYGFGLSERRFGHFLSEKPRGDFFLSTKVGRVFEAGAPKPHPLWKDPSPFVYRYDYTADGVKRAVEDSLQRLGLSRIDVVFVHDLAEDNNDDLPGGWNHQLEIAMTGAFPALTKLRDEGVIKAWGLGVNRVEPILAAMERFDPDISLLATQYSLANHEAPLAKLFPLLEKRGSSIVVGAPFDAGFLSGKNRWQYGDSMPADKVAKRDAMQKIAADYGVDLRTAALQFAVAPKVVTAVLPGGRGIDQVRANAASMTVKIPSGFWQALRDQKLIDDRAPTP
ncbi:MAG: aldo/keto reductase [Kofleriaceae bacterium]